ncbi:ribonuclease H [Trifolium pratense]|uniref:Ribonuclease H n=1 Tax=Trifolium pratense TaxID=57577 RepID=A0A2K3MAC3_TRIPR|nr:ribonuclease H [Trifolium pratense]
MDGCTMGTNTENLAQLLRTCFLKPNISPTTTMVRWNAHGGIGMILNVDGSSIGNPGISGFRGLIWNSDGAWVHDFAGNIGFSNILHAELLAVYHGLVLAWELDIKDLWCYSDYKIVIKLLSNHVNE